MNTAFNEQEVLGLMHAGSIVTLSLVLFYCAEMLAGGTALAFLSDALAYAASAGALYYVLKMNNYLARSYGKGKICGVCLRVFPFITSLVLGFGSARYIGNQSKN